MKIISVFVCLIVSSLLCKAQSELLPVDEQCKFIYYELVDAKGTIKNQLKNRINLFLKKPNEDLNLKTVQGDSVFIAAGKLVINKTVFVMSHPSGEILYRFQVEIKEGKYRFWLTDFNFIPYQRDRYGNFVPTTTKGMPLESDPGKLNSIQWKEYQTQTAKYARSFAKLFRDHMAARIPQPLTDKEKSIVTKNW